METDRSENGQRNEKRLAGRIAVITGASRGIGAAVARRFAAEGAHVVPVARTAQLLEELEGAIEAAGGGVTPAPLDLVDGPEIDRLARMIAERWGRLDILVGCAALLGPYAPTGEIPPEGWEEVIALNLTANWRLIRGFDPLLRASDAGRVIFVTSGVTHHFPACRSAYTASKAALEALALCYAAEMKETQVKVNMIQPGPVRTAMRAQAMPDEDPAAVAPPETVTDAFVELADPVCTRSGDVICLADGS